MTLILPLLSLVALVRGHANQRFGPALKIGFCFDSCCYRMTDVTKVGDLPPNARREQVKFCVKMFHEVQGDPCRYLDITVGRVVDFRSEAKKMCPCHKACLTRDTREIINSADEPANENDAAYVKVKQFVKSMGVEQEDRSIALQPQTSRLEIKQLITCVFTCVLEVAKIVNFGLKVHDSSTRATTINAFITNGLDNDTLNITCSKVWQRKRGAFHTWHTSDPAAIQKTGLTIKETGIVCACAGNAVGDLDVDWEVSRCMATDAPTLAPTAAPTGLLVPPTPRPMRQDLSMFSTHACGRSVQMRCGTFARPGYRTLCRTCTSMPLHHENFLSDGCTEEDLNEAEFYCDQHLTAAEEKSPKYRSETPAPTWAPTMYPTHDPTHSNKIKWELCVKGLNKYCAGLQFDLCRKCIHKFAHVSAISAHCSGSDIVGYCHEGGGDDDYSDDDDDDKAGAKASTVRSVVAYLHPKTDVRQTRESVPLSCYNDLFTGPKRCMSCVNPRRRCRRLTGTGCTALENRTTCARDRGLKCWHCAQRQMAIPGFRHACTERQAAVLCNATIIHMPEMPINFQTQWQKQQAAAAKAKYLREQRAMAEEKKLKDAIALHRLRVHEALLAAFGLADTVRNRLPASDSSSISSISSSSRSSSSSSSSSSRRKKRHHLTTTMELISNLNETTGKNAAEAKRIHAKKVAQEEKEKGKMVTVRIPDKRRIHKLVPKNVKVPFACYEEIFGKDEGLAKATGGILTDDPACLHQCPAMDPHCLRLRLTGDLCVSCARNRLQAKWYVEDLRNNATRQGYKLHDMSVPISACKSMLDVELLCNGGQMKFPKAAFERLQKIHARR